MLAHNVYFALKDSSDSAKAAMVAACKKYLADHPGVLFFACGTLQDDLDRPVNDRDFDVALHVVFDNRASHDLYQEAPIHKVFIDENRDNWAKVRVFDSACE
jgi:Stress responsive A/B Barrel Domain